MAPALVATKDRPSAREPARPPLVSASNAAVTAALTNRHSPAVPPLPAGKSPFAGQDIVGNGAVAAARRAEPAPTAAQPAAPEPAPAAAPTPDTGAAPGPKRRPGPAGDPKFARLKKDVQRKQRTVADSHPAPRTEAAAAQDAAVPPKDDQEAQGKTANAEKMNDAQPKEFDKDAFIRAVEKAITDKAPKNLDEADKFADSGKADEIRGEVQGKVGEGKATSAEQIATTTAAPPDTSAAVPKKVVPMSPDRPPATPGTPSPGNAVPDQLPPSATDMSAGPADIERRMATADVTETQLRRANEPSFTTALNEKKTVEQHSATAPGQLRKHEARQLRASTAEARRLGTAAMGAMGARRVRTGQQVGAGKTGAKNRDEDKRAEVTAKLQGVFDRMKADVEAILNGLDKKVDDQFTRDEKQARDAFTAEHKQKMAEYKDRRYSGATGKLRWVRDLFAGLPAEADKIFDEARNNYITRMRRVISDVATTIADDLNAAKRRIAQGRTELRAEVRALPAHLQSIGQQAAAEFTDRFDQLAQAVDDKGTELVDTLATKYTETLKAVDDEIAAEKEKNKGLVAKAVDAVKGVIDTILELKRLLLAVLAKAAQAVLGILRDPIGFLRNLVSAVGNGLRQFLRNIGRHLQQGIMSWLLGRASEAGLQLPEKFDTRGVLTMIAGLLGLTWPSIRARITRKVPERAVAAAETAVPLVAEVRRRGVAGMWEDLKTRLGDLRKDLLDKVIAYVTPTIVVAGITWVISLLNPASAFVRAVKLIIDIVRFVVTQARQIIDFVNAVLDAVIAIAKGAGGGVPGLVERALARSIPVLLGFLASLLGIGGIAAKVKQIVQAMSKPVNRAVDWVVDKIVGLVKKLWAKLKSALDKKKPKKSKQPTKSKHRKDRDRPGKPRRADKHRKPKDVKPRPDKPSQPRHADTRIPPEQTTLSMSGEGHTLIATPGEGVDIASQRLKVSVKAGRLVSKLRNNKKDPQREKKIEALNGIIKSAKKVERIIEKAEQEKGKKVKNLLDYPGFAKAFRDLKAAIVQYGTDFDAKDLVATAALRDPKMLEKEIRDDIVRVARHHDKEGPYEDVVERVVPEVNRDKKIKDYTKYSTSGAVRTAETTGNYPTWNGRDLIEGAIYRLIGRYQGDSGRTYNIVIGDQNMVGKKALESLQRLQDATTEAGGLPAGELRRRMSPGMCRAGHHRPDLRARFVGMVIEKYVAAQVAADKNIERGGSSQPGASIPDFLVIDGSRKIPVDITGSSSTSRTDHLKRSYISRATQLITYKTIDNKVLEAVFPPPPEKSQRDDKDHKTTV
ncbi:phage tail protein [Goodfellowiella coeruleoviolacea]|uniref:phage tail protein n=1 Tax=Goodfellowiella coeruleoviolacea TaxID=334858 RepID=UPI0020A35D10|nr:hypothetical protein [Goodfellowiella coeruleoviolacea]